MNATILQTQSIFSCQHNRQPLISDIYGEVEKLLANATCKSENQRYFEALIKRYIYHLLQKVIEEQILDYRRCNNFLCNNLPDSLLKLNLFVLPSLNTKEWVLFIKDTTGDKCAPCYCRIRTTLLVALLDIYHLITMKKQDKAKLSHLHCLEEWHFHGWNLENYMLLQATCGIAKDSTLGKQER